MPGVLIEAGLCGVPSVATPVQAIPEIVLPGTTGCLVPPDDPRALATGIEQALSHSVAFGAAARRHCLDHFEIGVVADAWMHLLSKVTK